MKEALEKIIALRYRCKKQKTISAHLVETDLLVVEKVLHSAHKTFNSLNKRAQIAEADNRRLRKRILEMEHKLNVRC